MAVAIGARPSIFFSSTDSKEVFVVHTAVTDAKAAKAERQSSFDCKRGLLALAAHPTDASTLFQLHDDSTVSAVALRGTQRNPDLLWNMALQPASSLATEVMPLSGFSIPFTYVKYLLYPAISAFKPPVQACHSFQEVSEKIVTALLTAHFTCRASWSHSRSLRKVLCFLLAAAMDPLECIMLTRESQSCSWSITQVKSRSHYSFVNSPSPYCSKLVLSTSQGW